MQALTDRGTDIRPTFKQRVSSIFERPTVDHQEELWKFEILSTDPLDARHHPRGETSTSIP